MRKGLLLCFLLAVSLVQADVRKKAPSTVKLNFPCDIKEASIARIWIDDEIFWDSDETGFLRVKRCEPLELQNLEWYDSIVVEYLVLPEQGMPQLHRFRLFPDGMFVPEWKIPQSKRFEL